MLLFSKSKSRECSVLSSSTEFLRAYPAQIVSSPACQFINELAITAWVWIEMPLCVVGSSLLSQWYIDWLPCSSCLRYACHFRTLLILSSGSGKTFPMKPFSPRVGQTVVWKGNTPGFRFHLIEAANPRLINGKMDSNWFVVGWLILPGAYKCFTQSHPRRPGSRGRLLCQYQLLTSLRAVSTIMTRIEGLKWVGQVVL